MRNLFFTAILVALGAAACSRRPLPQTDGNGGLGGGPSRGTGGAAGAGGTTVVDECLNHDIDLPSATLSSFDCLSIFHGQHLAFRMMLAKIMST